MASEFLSQIEYYPRNLWIGTLPLADAQLLCGGSIQRQFHEGNLVDGIREVNHQTGRISQFECLWLYQPVCFHGYR